MVGRHTKATALNIISNWKWMTNMIMYSSSFITVSNDSFCVENVTIVILQYDKI